MQQQQGGPQYGVPPEMPPPFTGAGGSRAHMIGIPGSDAAALAEAASPISSRPPPPPARGNFEEMAPGSSGFQDDDVGEEAERGPPGNRWPRQETLALLKIRSEMDAAFRDATLKGPLWEDVSRKLSELGYTRSAKKCKEKFENVHKYYKRTKEGRAGRQDGKSYRFFSQLEALHSNISSSTTTATTVVAPPAVNPPAVPIPGGVGTSNPMVGSSGRLAPPTPTPISSAAPPASTTQINVIQPIGPDLTGPAISAPGPGAAAAGISFSTSSSESDSDDEIEEGGSKDTRKRKRSGSSGGGSRKMMAFFEGLMKQVMEKQEAMQLRFLETIEKREQDRMMREESWKRQEMARLASEQEIMARERAMSASRDAAVIAFLQKITGQVVPIPSPTIIIPAAPPPPQPTPPPPPQPPPPPPPQQQQHRHQQQPLQQPQSTEIVRHQPSSTEVTMVPQEPPPHSEASGSGSFDPTSSRWPKTEVLALINMRSGLDSRYQETGPKGPLWEEISAGMKRLGYNRSSKRCKEKWENINKYFKKVKESNKKRPEDAKTCPYFHQLDALYRKKGLGSSSSFSNQNKQEQDTDTNPNPNPQEKTDVLAIMPPPPPPPPPQQQQHSEIKGGSSNKNGGNPDAGGGSLQVQTSNGGLPPSFFEGAAKKPEDIVKELTGHHHHQRQHQQPLSVVDSYDKLNGLESDNFDQEEEEEEDDEEEEEDYDDYDEDEDDDDEEDRKMEYKIQFQRPNAGPAKGEGSVAPAAPGSFLAMVQ